MRILLLIVVVYLSGVWAYNISKVFQVLPKTKDEIEAVAKLRELENVDFWSHLNTRGKPVDIMVNAEAEKSFENYLNRHGIKYTIIVENVERVFNVQSKTLTVKAEGKNISFAKCNTFEEINNYMKHLAKEHSDIVSIEEIGKSYEGRELNVIKISKDPKANKPIIFIDGGIHAREWMAPAQTTYVINQLVENGTNSKLLDKVDWHILPVLNPDGYVYTHSSINNRMWRKTRSKGKKCYGADANRNFDFHWGLAGTSGDECSEIFKGSRAFSELETQALRDHLLKYKKNIKLYLSFHGYGNYILYPWGYTDKLPNNSNELQELGELVANTIHKIAGTVYTIGSSTNVLYIASGGSDDWAKGVAGIQLSYTIELSRGNLNHGFEPSSHQILSSVSETWEGIKVFHTYIQKKFGK